MFMNNITKVFVVNINFMFYDVFVKKLQTYVPDIKVANYKILKEFKQWKNGAIKILIVDDSILKTDFSKTDFIIHIPFQGKDSNYTFSDVKYLESLTSSVNLNHTISIVNFSFKPVIDNEPVKKTYLKMPPLFRN
jgi:hypothetical protein